MSLNTPLPIETQRFCLSNCTVPVVTVEGKQLPAVQGLAAVDLVVDRGVIAAILPALTAPSDLARFDRDEGMIWPCFVDMHTHLDKGHIWERRPNPDGRFMSAVENTKLDRERFWSEQDVRARMEFSLKAAFAHGTRLIRTHLDTAPPQADITFPVFSELQRDWSERIALQAVALTPFDRVLEPHVFDAIVATTARHGGLLGTATRALPDLMARLDTLFDAAAAHSLDIDLHVDETTEAAVLTLEAIADAKLRHGFAGAVTVGHCCSLAAQDPATIQRVIDKVAEASISVVSLPMCNLYLQDRRPDTTPRLRGVTVFKELAAAGIATAVASDNTRDPFYAYGDLDPVEVFREAVRILHLDHPLDEAARIVTTSPATIVGRPDIGRIAVGMPADLVLFRARRWSEFLSRPQADRVLMRAGKIVDSALPDYRELDHLLSIGR